MPIHYAVDDHVVTITIDRPDRRNAVDMEHFDALADAWKRFRDDADAWVGSSPASPTRSALVATCATTSRCSPPRGPTTVTASVPAPKRCCATLDIYKPIIAAVNGPCVAGGMEMLNGTDIRLACPEAVFGVLEPCRGIFASGGTTARLPRQIPWPAAMEFLLTAEPVPATRALEMGLLNEIVPRHQLLDRAQVWAERITANVPLAVAATKESALRGMAVGTLDEAFRIEARLSRRVLDSNDAWKDRVVRREARSPLDRDLTRSLQDDQRDGLLGLRLVGVVAIAVDGIDQLPRGAGSRDRRRRRPVAVAGYFSSPTCTSTTGSACTLNNQPGGASAPPFDATITRRSPSSA